MSDNVDEEFDEELDDKRREVVVASGRHHLVLDFRELTVLGAADRYDELGW